jgi:hypothetical protein
MTVTSFRVPEEARSPEPIRALLTAQTIYDQVRAARRTFVNLLAVTGGVLWIALARGVAPASPLRYVGAMAWCVTLALVIAAGGLELFWRRRRDLAAASLSRS